MIEAIFFDLYETLITEWENGEKKATHSVEPLGISEETFKKEWNARVERRMDGTFPDYQSVLIDILHTLEKPIDDQILKRMLNERIRTKEIPFIKIDDGIIGTLHQIRALGIKIGLISNCTPEEVVAWETSQLSEFFDDTVFSFRAKCSKPNPNIYLMACKNIGVAPENAIFVGDGGSNELLGASKVGMIPYHATWFQPEEIKNERNLGFPQLNHPMEIVEVIKAEGRRSNHE